MRKKRAYRASDIKKVVLSKVLESGPAGAVTVGLDIGKLEIFAVVRWSDGTFERPWKVQNPSEIGWLVQLLRNMAGERPMMVAMESTGTYGDALRQTLTDVALDIQRVGGKAASDYAEIFDGVPSKHDGKDAAIVAELAALGKSWPWPYQSKVKSDAEMAYWADWLDAQQSIQMLWIGRLESLLARHWPEVTRLLDLTSVTLLRTLVHYGGPAKLAQDSAATSRLVEWGRRPLTTAKIEKVLQSAKETFGVRQSVQDVKRIQQYAASALSAYRETQKARRKLEGLAQGNEVIERQAKAIVRRWLYFAAMRATRDPDVRRWYEAKKARDGDRGKGALIGVARRLALALYGVAVRDEPFEAWRLFPGRSQVRRSLQTIQKVTRVEASKV